ncbi:hypothetical protein [Aliiglaciecola litoralis]|uniref:Gfo/Idh/MocA-like oxidoreductase N-terminal domain-containing protein n=1 Tax=Aliiglaciecola litoralis TaxID=582857 RepID=A0ABN1LKD6_9ALTE
MKRILLVGAGNLGSRHLQSIAKLEQPVNVVVVEPNIQAREIAKSRWQEIPTSAIHSLSFVSMNDLEPGFDIAVVATLSIDRLPIIKRLIELQVPNILSEKVIFQSVQLYQQALDFLATSNSQIYINYIYRFSNVIQDIQRECAKKVVNLDVNAGNVELGCNLIHYLDLGAFLNSGADITKLEVDVLAVQNNNPRHTSLKSFYGVATAEYSNGAILRASLLDDPSIDYTLKATADSHQYLINETKRKAYFTDKPLCEFDAPRVSDTTLEVINSLQQNRCVLPTLSDAFKVNQLMLDSLNMSHFGADDASLLCPIT